MLAQRFTINSRVGGGTYSYVYDVYDNVNRKQVAIKKFLDMRNNGDILSTTLCEIAALKYLNHPNILTIQGYDEVSFRWIVVDLYQNDLSSLMRGESLELPDIKDIVHQILSGLHYLHSRGFCHRDIKPRNILICKNQTSTKNYRKYKVVIGDMGFSKLYSNRVLTSKVCTLWYRAPELLLGHTEYSPNIDIWSLGCIVVEMIIGRTLWAGSCEINQLDRILQTLGTPNFDRNLKPNIYQTLNIAPKRSRNKLSASLSELLNTPNINDEMINLVENMLIVDPTERFCCYESLNHPLFQSSMKIETHNKTCKDKYIDHLTNYEYDDSYESLTEHCDLDFQMRNKLLDAMLEVCFSYNYSIFTYIRTQGIIDRFLLQNNRNKATQNTAENLNAENLNTRDFLLVGVAALFIASKIEEPSVMSVEEFLDFCDISCHESDIVEMEHRILLAMDMDVSFPLSLDIIGIYLERIDIPKYHKAEIEFVLMYVTFSTKLSKYSPALLVLFASLIVAKKNDLIDELTYRSGNNTEKYSNCANDLKEWLNSGINNDAQYLDTLKKWHHGRPFIAKYF